MLQRIQTIWLLLASLAGFLTLQFPFYSGTKTNDKQLNEFRELTASSHFLILILTVAVAVTSLIIIFLYRDRKTQFRLALVALLLSLGNIVLLWMQARKYVQGNYSLTALLALLVPIFIVLAIRGIYRDNQLIKNADRLR